MEKVLKNSWLKDVFPDCEIEEKRRSDGFDNCKTVVLLMVTSKTVSNKTIHVVYEIFHKISYVSWIEFNTQKEAEKCYWAVSEGLCVSVFGKSKVLSISGKS